MSLPVTPPHLIYRHNIKFYFHSGRSTRWHLLVFCLYSYPSGWISWRGGWTRSTLFRVPEITLQLYLTTGCMTLNIYFFLHLHLLSVDLHKYKEDVPALLPPPTKQQHTDPVTVIHQSPPPTKGVINLRAELS